MKPCTEKAPCEAMQLALDGTDPKKGGIATVLVLGKGQQVAFQPTKRKAPTMFLNLCPWCESDISNGVKW